MRPHPATAALGLILTSIVPLAAQQAPTPPAAGRGTIVGVVVDTAGRPVENVQLLLLSPRRQAITNRDGYFRLNDADSRRADVTARKIGYHPVRVQFELADGGSAVRIELVPVVRGLPTVITTAQSEGLSGVITDTDYRPIPGATIRAVGSGVGSVTTGPDGQFFSPVNPGHYLVEVNAAGFLSQMVSVTVPSGEGRRMAVLMRVGMRATAARQAAYLDTMRARIINRRTAYSRLFTREDITKLPGTDARQLATIGAMARVDESCEVLVDGGIERLPVWAIDAADIEFMEVYVQTPDRAAVLGAQRGSAGRMGGQIRQASSILDCPATIYVWMRK